MGTLIGAAAVLGCKRRGGNTIRGEIMAGPVAVGHTLRDGFDATPSKHVKTGIVIVGGGVSGLSAAWQLERSGYTDFSLLELHSETGGNSTSGHNEVSSYPWGAHYVPVASRESTLVQELFRELGVITSPAGSGAPQYKEEYLCAEPEERLFRLGGWQEGLVPVRGVPRDELDEHNRFFDLINDMRDRIGNDKKPWFSIPLDLSSHDPAARALDTIPFSNYLDSQGFKSPTLHWYLDYCCRDDYGSTLSETSAWAGIHYFASRRGWAANAAPSDVITWPNGNGWIVDQLTTRLSHFITSNAPVYKIVSGDGIVEYVDLSTKSVTRVTAEAIIWAAPRFIFDHLLASKTPASGGNLSRAITYRPWIVANLTLSEPPDGPQSPTAWDNVIYGSTSLGYVTATHQVPRIQTTKTVLTYYLPLADGDPTTARRRVYSTDWQTWRDHIVSDLSVPHPEISERIERIDVWRWGHGMVSPAPGYIWGSARRELSKNVGKVWFAHTDGSGISIFEEAQYRGVSAADEIRKTLRI